jgi:hypothetical protein
MALLNSCVEILTYNVIILGDGGLGRCLGHDGENVMNGISDCKRDSPESSIFPSAIWGHREKTAKYGPGIGASPATDSASIVILDIPFSRTARNKFVLFISCLD